MKTQIEKLIANYSVKEDEAKKNADNFKRQGFEITGSSYETMSIIYKIFQTELKELLSETYTKEKNEN